MAFPPSFVDEVVARNPIQDVVGQYVNLRRAGANYFGLCPFHGEKTASFSVAPDKGIYYCFGCHKGGGVVNFQMEIESMSYPDAIRSLAKRAGMEVPDDEEYRSRYRAQERLWALCKEAARFFHTQLYQPVGAEGLEYARSRGMTKAVLTNFGVGYAPDDGFGLINYLEKKGYTQQELLDSGLTIKSKSGRVFGRFRRRLMFPIIDVRGNVIAFGGRLVGQAKKSDSGYEEPKYLNSPETLIFNKRKNLFALNVAKKSKLPYLILVEGYMDAVSLHQYGFDCAVASLGTSLTEDHAAILTRYTDRVILIYDGDAAGQNATQRAIPMLEKAGLQVSVLQMRDAKDPDEYLKKFGADKFKLLLEDSSNRVEYQLSAIRKKYDISVDEQKVKFLQEAANLICTLGSPVRQEVYGRRVAEAASVSYEAVKIEVEKARKFRLSKEKKKQESISLAPARALQPKAASIRYDNIRSAMAEEGVLSLVLREPALFDQCGELKEGAFSSPFLGKIFAQLSSRYKQGYEVSVSVLEDVSADEISHLVGILQRNQAPVSESALRDCIRIINAEHMASAVSTEDDLMAYRNKIRERKGVNHGG